MGGLRFDGPEGSFVDADLPGVQGRVAFAALVVERRPISRGALAEIVWDGRPPDKWDGALSTIISRIRALITASGLPGRDVVTTVGGTYAIVPPADAWVDLEDAIRRLDRAEGGLRHGDLAIATAEGTVAFGILRRPFLVGVDHEWVLARRRRHTDLLHRCAVLLARAWIDLGDPGLAVTIAETAVDVDRFREIGHRLVIEAELARGDRGAARRAFERCERVLDSELGVGPSPETLALFDA
jgi:DNA-binding SARP family transcriptional activator